jgi:hypothetical protein
MASENAVPKPKFKDGPVVELHKVPCKILYILIETTPPFFFSPEFLKIHLIGLDSSAFVF